jgi:hypothetical protein
LESIAWLEMAVIAKPMKHGAEAMGLTERGTGRMNYVAVSGTALGASDLRTLESGRELLDFDLAIDGEKSRAPLVHVGYFPKGGGDVRCITNGTRVVVYGSLRHRFDRGGLFIAAREIVIAGSLDRHPDGAR